MITATSHHKVTPHHFTLPQIWKRILTVCFLLAAFQTAPLFASDTSQSGTHLIPRRDIPYRPASKIQTASAFKVGDPITIPAFSFQLIGGRYQTSLTCRLVGENCYIFVEDDLWNSRVSQSDITSLAQAFDQSTPRDANRGIFDLTTQLFGDPPDVDGDPRIIVAIIDVLDSPIQGFSIVGYYDIENQAPPISREIVYIDANPFAINTPLARATLAHEFQHMLHWKADPDEAKWLDEGCSEYAELACGYKDTTATEMASFLSLATNTGLTKWEDQSWDFDQAYLWTTYFAQTFGDAALRTLITNPDSGISSVDATLQALNKSSSFHHFFGQWSAAVYRDDYTAIDLNAVKSDTLTIPITDVSRVATLWGTDYLTLGNTSNLALTIRANGDNNLLITLIDDITQPNSMPIAITSGQTRRIHTYGTANRALAITTTSGTAQGYTLSVTAFAADSQSPTASDFDANGEVGFSDFIAFVDGFGKRLGDVNFDPTFDLNNDQQVAFADFLIFARNFGVKP